MPLEHTSLVEMKRCIYCNIEKEESAFTDEHVLPKAIGGNLSPTNPFKTNDVCCSCNSTCGLYVDTGFIKSWFTQMGRVEEALRYVQFSQETIFPLRCMGVIPGLEYDGKICEFWLGPAGDQIFHFHYPYPEVKDMPVLVGPAPNVRRGVDTGFAFIFVVPSNDVWWVPILRSFAAHFKGTVLYLANGPTPNGDLFSDIPPEYQDLHHRLDQMRKTEIHARLTVSIDSEARFLAKLALGLGHLFLNSSFAVSSDAAVLRDLLWARSHEDREKTRVHGSGFFGRIHPAIKKELSWPHGHLLTLFPVSNILALCVSFYGHQAAVIQISENVEHWKEKIPEGGIVFVVSPGLPKCVGPIGFPDYVTHRSGFLENPQLAALEREASRVPSLPPVDLKSSEPER